MKTKKNGTVFVHAGHWYLAARLPGDAKRRQYPLRAPGALHALAADRPRRMAEEAAARLWETATHETREADGCATVEEVCAAYAVFLPTYYKRPDGTTTSEADDSLVNVRLFREMYARAHVSELTHRDMLAHRDALVRSGVSRSTVNRRVAAVKRMLKWALDEALITAAAKAELTQVQNLKRGRSAAPETEPVRPVDDATVDRTLAALVPNTADMVRVHRLTGMRPDEMCDLEWSRIDTSATPWVYRPRNHKNSWRGLYGTPRAICIGPRAREILGRHRGEERPFSPAAAVIELMAAKREARKSPVQPSQRDRSKASAQRRPGEKWCTASYGRTVAEAARRAGIAPWGPNRLRHAFATKVRRAFGLEACRAVLGHSVGCVSRITDRYSYEALEEEQIRTAAPAVEALG